MPSTHISFKPVSAHSSPKFGSHSQVPHRHSSDSCCGGSSTDSVHLEGTKQSGRLKVDVAQADITQFPADAIIVGVYKDEDVYRKKRDSRFKQPTEEAITYEPLSGEAGKVDKALNGAILRAISETDLLDLNYGAALTLGSLFDPPLLLSKNEQKDWGVLAKYVIVVGLGERPDEYSGWAFSTVKDAHRTALRVINKHPEIKTAATVLHCAETGVFGTREEISEAVNILEKTTEEEYTDQPFSLQKLSIVSEDPKIAQWAAGKLDAPAPKSNEGQAKANSLSANDSTGFFSNIWNAGEAVWSAVASVFTGIYNGIKGLLGWK